MIQCTVTEIRGGKRQVDPTFLLAPKNALRSFTDCTLRMGYEVVKLSPTEIHFSREWKGIQKDSASEEVWSGPVEEMATLCELALVYCGDKSTKPLRQAALKLAA
jgi:hypothetical protein